MLCKIRMGMIGSNTFGIQIGRMIGSRRIRTKTIGSRRIRTKTIGSRRMGLKLICINIFQLTEIKLSLQTIFSSLNGFC